MIFALCEDDVDDAMCPFVSSKHRTIVFILLWLLPELRLNSTGNAQKDGKTRGDRGIEQTLANTRNLSTPLSE